MIRETAILRFNDVKSLLHHSADVKLGADRASVNVDVYDDYDDSNANNTVVPIVLSKMVC
jgi:hypothetical protein